jgi:guanine deaminase
MKEEEIMIFAIKKAREGIENSQTPFGACIIKDGKIINCAHNTVWNDNDITAHEEINAIKDACEKLSTVDLSGCIIYSTCEPCPKCFAACHWAKISKIVYVARLVDAKRFGFNELMISNNEMKQVSGSKIEIV